MIYPGKFFSSPKDVVGHPALSLSEKRAILASWVSDAAAVASCPALRLPREFKKPVLIDDVLEALSELDGPPEPPGGVPMRRGSIARMAAA